MVLRLWVPPIQRPSARKRNCASEGWSATAAMVAKSLGVSTPLRGTGGLRGAGASSGGGLGVHGGSPLVSADPVGAIARPGRTGGIRAPWARPWERASNLTA